MTDEVRNDFIEMIRRAADFCGIRLIAWCIMTNHFHILAYLPQPEDIGEDEIFRRYGVLKGAKRRNDLEQEIAALRQANGDGEIAAQMKLDAIKASMYKIGEFMKIIKQWLTQEYNSRYSHTGTLWEGVYKDVLIRDRSHDLAKVSAYINLNPVRAGMTSKFDDYCWSSFTAHKRGDHVAIEGLRRIYGEETTPDEVHEAHARLMAELLEQIKLDRAMELVRKRAAGIDAPIDHLTSEALLAQAATQIEQAASAFVEEQVVRRSVGRPSEDAELRETILKLLAENPKLSAQAIIDVTGRPRSTVFRCLKRIREQRVVSKL